MYIVLWNTYGTPEAGVQFRADAVAFERDGLICVVNNPTYMFTIPTLSLFDKGQLPYEGECYDSVSIERHPIRGLQVSVPNPSLLS